MKTVYDYKTLTTITTSTTIRLSEECLRLWKVYDYERLTTMEDVYDYDTNRHKFRCKFIIKLYKKILRKKEEKNQN